MTRTIRFLLYGLAGAVLLSAAMITGAVVYSSNKPATTPAAFVEATPVPSFEPITPAATTSAPMAPPTTKAAKAAPITFEKLTAREWKKVAKSPDDYLGDHYVVYGVVTQFDAATGSDSFRADVDGVRRASEYDYDTNTMFVGESSVLADLVEDDRFTAKVTVLGSYDYETQIGGSTTVPQLHVVSVQVL
ncbi:hypothetical protein KOI35_32735 [Actinoplanes bogorensis]|uniref:Uncharacterized protein n=1 Tax=Paractinoplanes bogorensis TaxID=1610840 RepID=A0ABS5YXW4_9ACTN|nr:hypothetical protein [Actinoplanes bogorensis]MBU2668289.1 hypothetical protein [Actinoplanes bogorensis]